MIIIRLSNSRFTSIITTFIITLLVSACGPQDLTSADNTNNPAIDTGITPVSGNESNSGSNINLSWVAPSEREDNSSISLSEIAGYTIRYGTMMGQYPNKITINDGTATDYTLPNFITGTYYFVLTTIDTEGRESQYSSVATVVN